MSNDARNHLPESRFITVPLGSKQIRLHYHDVGHGAKVVVMLHGSGPGASGWSNFHRNVLPLVEAGYRVLLLDCPGWSKSDPVVSPGSRSDLNAEALLGVLNALAIGEVDIIGNSMGAHSTVAFALGNPTRVRKLILMGGGVGSVSIHVPMPTEGIKWVQKVYREPTLENLKQLMTVFVHDPRMIPDELIQERHRNMLEGVVNNNLELTH